MAIMAIGAWRRLASMALLCVAVVPAGAAEETTAPSSGNGSGSNYWVSIVLIVSVAFIMLVLYAVNHSDDDLRKAGKQTVSSTISIFAAVLFFQACQGFLQYAFSLPEEEVTFKVFVVYFVQGEFWFVASQLILFLVSVGYVTTESGIRELRQMANHKNEIFANLQAATSDLLSSGEVYEVVLKANALQEKANEVTGACPFWKVTCNQRCWGVLTGHIAGFAAISAFGAAQQIAVATCPQQYVPLVGFLSVLASGALIHAHFYLVQILRARAQDWFAMPTPSGISSEQLDELGETREKLFEMWNDVTEESENDVMGVMLGFLLMNVARSAILSLGRYPVHFPNIEGELGAGEDCNPFLLILLGTVIPVIRLLRGRALLPKRFAEFGKCFGQMFFAWCFFFGTQNIFHRYLPPAEAVSSVVSAFNQSLLSMVLIFLLDKAADVSSPSNAKFFRHFIAAFGVLIGFAWERAFDATLGDLVKENGLQYGPGATAVLRIVAALAAIGLVLPAWRNFILPEVVAIQIQEEKEEEEEGEKEEENKAARTGHESQDDGVYVKCP
eukprot:TRINITY_DN49936_c0_g1_i1.p1 TRINITY_DN49936_c0_g1~~TRINITY_DN49936_c0_g1_i1.p1  ORF type:complete len:569 (+),score=102.90 TRINITY_DN49936_c0_g1_i1:39-1709(+)